MLTIKPEENYTSALEEMGIEAKDNMCVMTMKDGSCLMGVGVIRIFEDYAVVDTICIKSEFEDFSLFFGMGKSLLNVIDLRGIRNVVTNDAAEERVLTALRFKPMPEAIRKENEKLAQYKKYLNLEGYFDTNCSNCTKE